jgi:hypothetical protein
MFHNLFVFFDVVLLFYIVSIYFQVLHLPLSFSHSLLVLYKPLEAYIWGFNLGGFKKKLVFGY